MAKRRPNKREQALTRLVGHLINHTLVARYDALKRQPTREQVEIRSELSQTEQWFPADRRITAYTKCDNLVDNTPLGSIIDTCVRLTIGKAGGNLIFSGPDKDTMTEWFRRWRRHAGYDEGETLQEVLGLILRCVKTHGDCLVWIDETLTAIDGEPRIRIFDADMICNVAMQDFSRWKEEHGLPDSCRMVEGAAIDGTGHVHGWFVTMLRNRYCVSIDDAMFLPANVCRRVAYKRKYSQYRGEPQILSNEEISQDTKSLLKSEIGAAKLASELPLIVEAPPGVDTDSISKMVEGYENLDELEQDTGIDVGELQMLDRQNDERTFEAFEGHSAVANVANGTKVTNLNNANRPSQQIQSWVDNLNDSNGRVLGVMSCLSRGRADNSYSSGMVELQISWKAFEEDQELLTGVLDYIMETLWPSARYDVYWPGSISIDPYKEQQTLALSLKNGLTSYREILGSDWQDDLKELAAEKEFIKSLGLTNLSIFQTISGMEVGETRVQAEIEKDEAESDIEKDKEGDNDNG